MHDNIAQLSYFTCLCVTVWLQVGQMLQVKLDEVMFINCSQCFVTDSSISCAKCKTAFCVTLHRDKVQDEEAAHITPPHYVQCRYVYYVSHSVRQIV